MKLVKIGIVAMIAMILLLAIASVVWAAPYNGQIFKFKQPDNTYVQAKIYGDEFYQRAESLDGYTLCRDTATGYICYAKLNADGSDYISTGVIYRGGNQTTDDKLRKSLRLKTQSIDAKVNRAKQLLHPETDRTITDISRSISGPMAAAPTGNIKGLAVLINFPNQTSSIGKTEIDNMLNLTGYSNYSNKGSVKDYFYEVSGGKVTYTNYVTDFYTAKHPKSYYTDPGVTYAYRAAELLQEALTDLNNRGFDFSTLTTDANRNVLAINAFYAGQPDSDWGKGLWPHQGSLPTSYSVDGVTCRRYQMSNIGNSLVIGTTVHENGHLVFSWPDLYDYDGDSAGAGSFCVMAYNNDTNPQVPNPYLRQLAGWMSYSSLNGYANGSQISVNSGSLGAYCWTGSNSNEFFLVENIRRTGRWAALPGEGLLIWHIETNGSNDYNQMTASQHFKVSVEQADGSFHLERNNNSGQANDFYYSGNKTLFDNTTTPKSNWWNGSASGLKISNVGAIGNTITFTLGNGNPITPTPTRQVTATPTPTRGTGPTPTPGTGSISIACGSSSAVGSFAADQYYSGGSAYSNTNTVDVSQITSTPPPAALFNNERYGAMSYTIPGFASGSMYTVSLYFAETYLTSSGKRLFNVSINGSTVLSNFDIYASAGGQNKAIARSFTATANASGQMVIQFTNGTENAKINGISIKPVGSNPTPTPTPSSTPTPTRGINTPTPTPTSGTGSISIAAGSTSAVGSFQADQYYSGGSAYSNTNTIDVSQIASNPPPAALFNKERYGAMSYTIPGFTAGSSYTVTLYFAETYLTASGRRLFSVSINGAAVLSNFDIYASAGGQNKAIARSFTATANPSGQIVIQFTSGTENPKINGISIR